MRLANKIKIRHVIDSDLKEVFPLIDKENWYWTLSEVEHLLKIDKTHSVVAVLNNAIVGILFVLKKGSFAIWTHFIVKDKFRNTGIGIELIKYNFDDFSKSGVDVIDIIAVSNKVNFYKNFKFNKTEDILIYENNTINFSGEKSESDSIHCKRVNIKELEKNGSLETLEENTNCSLMKLTGGLVYDGVSPVIGYYEENVLKGIMLSHAVANYIDFGPWLIEDITMLKAKRMLLYSARLVKGKNISISISSENKLAKELVESAGFKLTEKLARMVRADKPISALHENLICIGKF